MSDALYVFCEIAMISVCGCFAYEGILRLSKPKVRVPSKEWREMIDPVVKKCRLAVTLDLNTSFNPDGSRALATMLEAMADELDRRS